MNVEGRKEVLAAVGEARSALSRTWKIAHVGTGDDPELDRVVAGIILPAESHLWEASAALDRLIAEDEEGRA